MHQLVKLTDAIYLQLASSSLFIHALGDPSQTSTGIRTRVPILRGGWLTNWAIPPPIFFSMFLLLDYSHIGTALGFRTLYLHSLVGLYHYDSCFVKRMDFIALSYVMS